jgi:hypothetical protein
MIYFSMVLNLVLICSLPLLLCCQPLYFESLEKEVLLLVL